MKRSKNHLKQVSRTFVMISKMTEAPAMILISQSKNWKFMSVNSILTYVTPFSIVYL